MKTSEARTGSLPAGLVFAVIVSTASAVFGLFSVVAWGSRTWTSLGALAGGGVVCLLSWALSIYLAMRSAEGSVISGDPVADRYATETGPPALPYVALFAFFVAFGALMVSLARISDGAMSPWLAVAVACGTTILLSAGYLVARIVADTRLASANAPYIEQQIEDEMRRELGTDYEEFVRDARGSD